MARLYFILFALFSTPLYAQVEGVIIDGKTKQPVAFANIWIENENIGTTSSTDGHFSISEKVENKRLFISAIGYESQFYTINKTS